MQHSFYENAFNFIYLVSANFKAFFRHPTVNVNVSDYNSPCILLSVKKTF